jgi:two-component system phosphate regulon sensor histidine kinase PhoR
MATPAGLSLSPRDAGILDSIPEPVVIVDRLRVVSAANAAAVRDVGIAYTGRALALSLRHPAALAALDEVLVGAEARTIEVTLRNPAARTFSLIVAPLHGAAGAVLVFHDITSERRAQQMRADFVANASHELRSPLSALVGFIETLRGPAKDDAAARTRFLEIMATEAGRMTRLIEHLLSLSAIEADEHVTPEGRVDVVQTLAGVVDTLTPAAAAKDMRIRTEILVALPPVIADADQLTQVFHNLIENAIAYGRAGTEVLIVACPIERMPGGTRAGVAVSVQDEGEGIPPEHIPRLTERFYRVDAARSRKLGGTGLGLAIVKHILNRHRSKLSIESEQGRGSRFTVSLPAA